MSKVQSALYIIFLILFVPVMTTMSKLYIDFAAEPKYYYYPIILIALFIGALFLFKKCCDKADNKFFYPVLVILSVSLFLFQFLLYQDNPELILYGDYKAMYLGFREISSYGHFTEHLEYFLAHKHQLFTALFYGVLNRIFVIIGFTGPVNAAATIAANCILINIGGILLAFSVKNITTHAYALLSMLIFCLFNSYWGCMLYAYTHTLSVFFVGLVIFCFSCFFRAEQNKFKYLWLIVSGAAFALCKSAEGITLIAFVAALIYIIISCERIKPMLLQLLTVVLSFVVCLTLINGIYDVLGIIDETNSYKYEFPLTHWIMMGQGETGQYNEEDYQATVGIEGKQEKAKFHKEEIINRLSSRTPAETVKFWLTKQSESWLGGTYGARTKFPDNFAYNFAYRFFLAISILAGAIFSLINILHKKKKAVSFLAFSQIYTIGVFFFFCIWEVSFSYLFSSIPMLILCAVLSLYTIVEQKQYK